MHRIALHLGESAHQGSATDILGAPGRADRKNLRETTE